MKRGECVACGSTKTQFIKECAVGGSFLNSAISKASFRITFAGTSFYWSWYKLDNRLNVDETPTKLSIPINRIDNAAYSKHDHTKTSNEVCDMLNELDGIVDRTLRDGIYKSMVRKLIKAKVWVGLSYNKTNS